MICLLFYELSFQVPNVDDSVFGAADDVFGIRGEGAFDDGIVVLEGIYFKEFFTVVSVENPDAVF